MNRWTITITVALLGAGLGCASALGPAAYEQTYLQASHNWAFRDAYPDVDRLFNAFDFGHAIEYETLIVRPGDGTLDGAVFDRLTRDVLVRGPSVALDAHAIAPRYATLAPEIVAMFEWAHMLHRQIYDVWADRRLSLASKDARIGELVAYYRSRRDLAFSTKPKAMSLMEDAAYSKAFRRADPQYNGLIWSYHWLQMALYEALMAGDSAPDRDALVSRTVAHFRSMVNGAPGTLPTMMPMSPAIAPRFAARYPEAAIIFDNLHALHDVVADILASPVVPPRERRQSLLTAAAAYRDDTTSVTTVDEWLMMSRMMDVDAMGGAAPVASVRPPGTFRVPFH